MGQNTDSDGPAQPAHQEDEEAPQPAQALVTATNALTEEEFQDLYGPWEPLRPPAVREVLVNAPFQWWIAGAWAVDAASGHERHHDDIDVAVLRRDLAQVREWLAGYHL